MRDEAFGYLRRLQTRTGGPVSQSDLCGSACGFRFENQPLALKHPQRGIHKPRTFEAALSFSTTHKPPGRRPYDDAAGADGYLRYKWQGSDPDEYTNAAMRKACARGLPLIWFHGIVANVYLPVFPVWLVHEEPDEQQFVVALDPVQRERWQTANVVDLAEYRRNAAAAAGAAIHRPLFRARVLAAYESRCAICHLPYDQLLDAATIRRHTDGGELIVSNGISLCGLHHGAYDTDLLGIDADYRVEVRQDVLRAPAPSRHEGPPVQAVSERPGGALAALREAHRGRLHVPDKRAARPNRELLAERFERYRFAG
jgi:putative restriction endonuclease